MAVTVYSLGQVANVQAILRDGGNLAPNTTYYVRVDPIRYSDMYSGGDLRYPSIWGLPSTEISFTTTATMKSVDLTWDALANADGYKIYMTTVSGDYTGANKAFQSYYQASVADTSFSITDVPSYNTSMFNRSWIYEPALPGSVPAEGGRLGVKISGTVTLQDIKDAVDAAELSDHCYYDGILFVLRGFIYSKSGDGTTSLAQRYKLLYFVEGDLASDNSSATFSFGTYSSTEQVASQKCILHFMGYANILYSWTAGDLNLYCDVKGKYGSSDPNDFNAGYIAKRTNGVNLLGGSIEGFAVFVPYTGSGGVSDFISRNVGDIQPYEDASNMKIYNGRFVITGSAAQDPSDCAWENIWIYQDPSLCNYGDADIQVSNYNGINGVYSIYSLHCLRDDNQPCIYWYMPNGGSPTFRSYSEVALKIVDKNNSPIPGAIVTVKNKNGTQEFSVTTNADGEFDAIQYVLSQSAVPSGGSGIGTTWTTYSPFVINVQREGYGTHIGQFTISESINWRIALRHSPYADRNNMGHAWR